MYRTRRVFIGRKHKRHGYCNELVYRTRALRNSANYIIRNVSSALYKKPEDRTPAEDAVLVRVYMCITAANGKAFGTAIRKAVKLLAEGHTLMANAVIHEAIKKEIPIPDEKHNIPGYRAVDAVLKVSDDPCYRSLPSQTAQQAIKKTCESWKAYFAALREYKKNPSAFTGCPQRPGYIREKLSSAVLTNQMSEVSIKNGKAVLSMPGSNTSFEGKDLTLCIGAVSQGKYYKTEICPSHGGFYVLITFEEETASSHLDRKRMMGMDPGLGNFLTCVCNFPAEPLIFKGGYLKALNQWYNKRKAELVSELTNGHETMGKVSSQKLDSLGRKRDDSIRDVFYKTAHYIGRYCEKHDIGTVVIGHSMMQKQEVSLGRKNNQGFVSIPYTRFILILETVLVKYGAGLIQTEESYTSKASFLDNDEIPVYGDGTTDHKFSGRRIHRGLYRTADGSLINADVNGAANILRKTFPDAFAGVDTSYLMGSVETVSLMELAGLKPHSSRRAKKESWQEHHSYNRKHNSYTHRERKYALMEVFPPRKRAA